MAGVDLLHLPYQGTGQALTDLRAGPIQVLFAPAQTVMPHVQAGKLRALALGGEPESNNTATTQQTVTFYAVGKVQKG